MRGVKDDGGDKHKMDASKSGREYKAMTMR
jgi:hypothetical protein